MIPDQMALPHATQADYQLANEIIFALNQEDDFPLVEWLADHRRKGCAALITALDALCVESGGAAIPNGNLTIARNHAIALLHCSDKGRPMTHLRPTPSEGEEG